MARVKRRKGPARKRGPLARLHEAADIAHQAALSACARRFAAWTSATAADVPRLWRLWEEAKADLERARGEDDVVRERYIKHLVRCATRDIVDVEDARRVLDSTLFRPDISMTHNRFVERSPSMEKYLAETRTTRALMDFFVEIDAPFLGEMRKWVNIKEPR